MPTWPRLWALLRPASEQEPAPPLEVTCGDLLFTLRDADLGKKLSAARLKQATEEQDDVAIGLYWIHGVIVGSKDAAAPGLTKDWMGTELRRLVEACKTKSPDGKMTLIQMVQQ